MAKKKKKKRTAGKKDPLQQLMEKMWPKTKKQMDKAVKNTRKAVGRGEDYLKELSKRSAKETQKLSLGLQKERLHYDLGKAVAAAPATKWKTDKKIGALLRKIKKINIQIKKLK